MNIIIEIAGGNIVAIHRSISMIGDKVAIVDRDLQDIGSPPVSMFEGDIQIYSDITDVFPQDNNADREILDELKAIKF